MTGWKKRHPPPSRVRIGDAGCHAPSYHCIRPLTSIGNTRIAEQTNGLGWTPSPPPLREFMRFGARRELLAMGNAMGRGLTCHTCEAFSIADRTVQQGTRGLKPVLRRSREEYISRCRCHLSFICLVRRRETDYSPTNLP